MLVAKGEGKLLENSRI